MHASGQGNGLSHGTGPGDGSGARGRGVGPFGVSGTHGGMGMIRPCGCCGVGGGGTGDGAAVMRMAAWWTAVVSTAVVWTRRWRSAT